MPADDIKNKTEENKEENAKSTNAIKENDENDMQDEGKQTAAKKKEKAALKIKPPAKKRAKVEQAEKEVVEAKEEEDEADDEAEDEENGKVPLLDQPLELSGGRERKQVDRFVPKEQKKEEKAVDIAEGAGTPLGKIPRIENNISFHRADNLKELHKLLFNRIGKVTEIKKNLRKFCGLGYTATSKEGEKKKVLLEKKPKKILQMCLGVLDLPLSGPRTAMAERLLEFLIEPKVSGKPAAIRPKRKDAAKRRYLDESDSDSGKPTKKKARKPKSMKEATDSEGDLKEEDANESEEEEEVAKPTPKKTLVAKKEPKKKVPPKKVVAKKGGKKKKDESENENEDDDNKESDDEPLTKKSKKTPPTDDDIRNYVKSVLEGANLEEITMKTVCKEVYSHYPEFDLGYKKDFIKTTVKSASCMKDPMKRTPEPVQGQRIRVKLTVKDRKKANFIIKKFVVRLRMVPTGENN